MVTKTDKKPHITVYKSIGGWKAVLLCWAEYEDLPGFWEPNGTGPGYQDINDAIAWGKDWAQAEEIQFIYKEN